MSKTDKLEQKNLDRAAGLVVRIQRAIERNTTALFQSGNKMQEEQQRHIKSMDALRLEQQELKATKAELEKELADAREYLQDLTEAQTD